MKKYTIHTRFGAPVKIEADGHGFHDGFTEFYSPGGGRSISTDEIVQVECEEIPPTVEELAERLAAAERRNGALRDAVREAKDAAFYHSWSRFAPGGRFAKQIYKILSS